MARDGVLVVSRQNQQAWLVAVMHPIAVSLSITSTGRPDLEDLESFRNLLAAASCRDKTRHQVVKSFKELFGPTSVF